MRVGLALPHYDSSVPGERPLPWPTLRRWARAAEELGFGSLWVSDHLFVDAAVFGGPPERVGAFDALPLLGALARVTRSPRLGTLVLCTPLRPATVVAKALTTVDVLSAGRVIAGLGAGWFEPEFEAAGVPFERAGVRLEGLADAIGVMRRTWAGEGPPCRPQPAQDPAPPIWVGGRGDRLLRLVARHADGWNTAWTATPDSYLSRSAYLDAACVRAGRDPAEVVRTVGLHALVGENERDLRRRFERLRAAAPAGAVRAASVDEWRRGRLVGTVEQVREQVDAWAAVGVRELIVNAGPIPFHVVDLEDLPAIATACSLLAPCPTSDL